MCGGARHMGSVADLLGIFDGAQPLGFDLHGREFRLQRLGRNCRWQRLVAEEARLHGSAR